MDNEGFIMRSGAAAEITPVQEQSKIYEKGHAFTGLIRLKGDHAEDDTVALVMANLPANRLWTTVTFNGLGHILFLTKFISDAPAPDDLVARVISQAAQLPTWTFHAKDWIARVCGERLAASNRAPEFMRRMSAWQSEAGVKE
eukprot:2895110-Heterocapsa_arctica.AAC.1